MQCKTIQNPRDLAVYLCFLEQSSVGGSDSELHSRGLCNGKFWMYLFEDVPKSFSFIPQSSGINMGETVEKNSMHGAWVKTRERGGESFMGASSCLLPRLEIFDS